MGLCIRPDENKQRVHVEIRGESVVIMPGEIEMMKVDCVHSDFYGWYVEITKGHLRKLVEFFVENPEHLEMKGGK